MPVGTHEHRQAEQRPAANYRQWSRETFVTLSAERLVPQSSALAATALTGRFAVPVFVIQGSASIAKEFVDGVEAPDKAFVAITGGHFAVFMNSSAFLKELSALLRITAR